MIDFPQLITQLSDVYVYTDWQEWRYCYQGGRLFRDTYLEQYTDREDAAEFNRRRNLTPIPTYAKKEVKRVINSVAQRFPDINRYGGTASWWRAVSGLDRGVDLRSSAMNTFMGKTVLEEAATMAQCGVLVDAPPVNGPTAADIPKGFRPYLIAYPVESFRVIPAPVDSESDWEAVLLKDVRYKFNRETLETVETVTYRYFWLNERGTVSVQKIDDQGKAIGGVKVLNTTMIPFVVTDLGDSLIRDAASYQIAALNMISTDSNYAIDSNFPFLTRQRGNNNAGAHLIGDDDEAEVGLRKGLFYDKNLNAPAFISPPSEPMKISLELRKEMKAEVRELVTGALVSMGDDGSLEAGLAWIGGCLQAAERRIWDHWVIYEQADPARRKVPTVSYPDSWSLKTDAERIEEAKALLDLGNAMLGRTGRKEIAKMAADRMFRGKKSVKEMEKLWKEIDDSPSAISDPEIIFKAKDAGLVSAETGSLALGFPEGEAEKAQEDSAKRAKDIVAAQTDAAGGAAQGAEDLSVDPESNKLAREGEADTTAKLGGDDDKGVRGEGKDTDGD